MRVSLFLPALTWAFLWAVLAPLFMLTTRAATMPMMAMTTSISIRVKACLLFISSVLGARARLGAQVDLCVPYFLFHSFAEPLLDHALIIEIAGAGKAFNAGEHARIHAQSDGDGIGQLAARRDGTFHETNIDAGFGPKGGFGFLAVEKGNFFPIENGVHRHDLLSQGLGEFSLIKK